MTPPTAEPPEIRPGSFGAWLLAARPKTLAAAVAPVLVGTACAWAAGGFAALGAAVALFVALTIQIGTNFANDVFDFEKGADTGERLGPVRAVQAGLLTPREMRAGMVIAFALAAAGGLSLFALGGWPMLVIGIASIAAGLAYTGGPFPLAYHGLGDVFVLIFFGFVAVTGTVYVQMGAVPELAWWAAVPPGALATAILAVNNLRDRATDAVAGKRTLAVRMGAAATRAEIALLVASGFVVPVILAASGKRGVWVLLPLLTLPLAWRLLRDIGRRDGRELNPCLAATARLLFVHSLLFAAGIALGGG